MVQALVQAFRPDFFSVTNECRLQYALDCSIILDHTDRHEQRKRVTYSNVFFFVKGLGLALAANTCPNQPQGLKRFSNSQACPWEQSTMLLFHFF